jgi:hypothetical protein
MASAAPAATRPDLTVAGVRATPPAVETGGGITVGATLRNRGRVKAGPSTLGIYLSRDRRAGADAVTVSKAVARMRAGARRSVSTVIHVPPTVSPGTWFVLACADARGRIREKRERNNCRAARVTVTAPTAPPPADLQPRFPVRATFYYPWFSGTWKQNGLTPYTHYHPTLGYYDSSSHAVIQQHLQAMTYAGIQVGISSWWGQGERTDARVPDLLGATRDAGSPVRWALYYEAEAQGDPSPGQIASDLAYIRDRYGSDPAFFRINGRFVVFVYADAGDACAMVDRWKQANAGIGAYVVLKVFTGYHTCATQPDAWHQYAPAKAADSRPGESYSVSPGFYKADEPAPRLARDLGRFQQDVRNMVASGAPFQLVTTFNEWGEGTAVESADEWASSSGYGAYLDALHSNGG